MHHPFVPPSRRLAAGPLAALVGAVLLAACSPSPTPAPKLAPSAVESAASAAVAAAITPAVAAAVAAGSEAGIDWRKPHGEAEIEAAFAEARTRGLPVFLYWGAVWCPPCNQVKATVFSRADFIDKSRGFVPIYLDGDSPGAQKMGERFKVRGYPTMLLLRPDGSELTRLPGEVDAQKYLQVLSLGLGATRPVKEVLAQALARPATLGAEDWRLLAYYAWDVDEQQLMTRSRPATVLRRLAQACPPAQAEAATRLLFKSLVAQATEPAAGTARPPARHEPALRLKVMALLADDAAVRQNLDIVVYYAKALTALLTAAHTPEREQMASVWAATLDRLTADARLSQSERIGALYSRVELARLDAGEGAPLSTVLREHVQREAARADREVTGDAERQAVINVAGEALSEAGLLDESDRLLKAELQRSHSPYYAMLVLAGNAEQRGDKAGALDWYERAYQAAQGPATRVQWGTTYVNALVKLAPQDGARIAQAAGHVLDELKGQPDAFYARSATRLQRMSAQLLAWNRGPAQAAVLADLKRQRDALCNALPAGDPQRATCAGLFAAGTPTKTRT